MNAMTQKIRKPVVVAIGPNDMDRYYSCAQPLIVGSKCVIEPLGTSPGGFIANAACVLGALGTEAYLFDTVGGDEYHDLLVNDLAAHHVHTEGIESGDYGNYIVDILLSEGERTCLVHGSSKPHVTIDASRLAILERCDFVYTTFSTWRHLDGYRDLALHLRKRGVRFMFDAERTTFTSLDDEEDSFMFGISAILSLNTNAQNHLLAGGGTDAFAKLTADPERILLLTNGAQGVELRQGDVEEHVPAFQVPAVDTTGAGDTFNGAFLHAFLSGASLRQAAVFASAAAAIAVQKLGSRSGAVAEQAVLNFLQERQ
ncbi:MAG: carbohydrate kinase family protein [Sphaerochaetaceae bacterium]|nr:carbohydrate kinase family protein [Sphaerochaetaceae bacterium]